MSFPLPPSGYAPYRNPSLVNVLHNLFMPRNYTTVPGQTNDSELIERIHTSPLFDPNNTVAPSSKRRTIQGRGRPRATTEEQDATICHLFKEMKTNQQIANAVGISLSTVKRRLQEVGLRRNEKKSPEPSNISTPST